MGVLKGLLYGAAAIVVLSVILGAVFLVTIGGVIVCLFGIVALTAWFIKDFVEYIGGRSR